MQCKTCRCNDTRGDGHENPRHGRSMTWANWIMETGAEPSWYKKTGCKNTSNALYKKASTCLVLIKLRAPCSEKGGEHHKSCRTKRDGHDDVPVLIQAQHYSGYNPQPELQGMDTKLLNNAGTFDQWWTAVMYNGEQYWNTEYWGNTECWSSSDGTAVME